MILNVAFTHWNFKDIPDVHLDFLLKNYDEVYRMGDSVLFRFKASHDHKDWLALFNWVTEIEIGDYYNLIIIDEDNKIEKVGCSDDFDLHTVTIFKHANYSQINSSPCEIKSLVLNDEDRFDLGVKRHGLS